MGPRPISRGEYVTCHARNKNPAASMGPRPISRGEKTAGSLIDAYLGLQWGRGRSAAERPKERSSDRGTFWLQWGRGRSAAESHCQEPARRISSGFNGAAADQPRRAAPGVKRSLALRLQWGRGRSAAERPIYMDFRTISVRLQWGRGRSAAERAAPEVFLLGQAGLQWGRRRSAAERRHVSAGWPYVGPASMGPRPISRGEQHAPGGS